MAQPPLLREEGEYACPNRLFYFGQLCLRKEGTVRVSTVFPIWTAVPEGVPLRGLLIAESLICEYIDGLLR